MGSNDKLAATFHPDRGAVSNELLRRRELAGMTKPELITHIVKLERQHGH